MPNWCNNTITITGPKDKIKKIWETAQTATDGGFGLLQAFVPMPKELEGTVSPTPVKGQSNYTGEQPMIDGATNWYDWRIRNWGIKWDVDDTGLEYEDTEDGYATISGWFDSPWGPPIEAYQKIREQDDEIQITACYHEPGMDFAGVYEDDYDDCIENLTEEFAGGEDLWSPLARRLDEEFGIVEQMEMWDD